HGVHWVLTAFLLVSGSTLIRAGRLGDVLGRERVWRAGVLIFSAASAAAMLMPGLWWLVGARAFQGLGAALATASSAAILVDAFPDSRGKMMGLGNIAIAAGPLAAPPRGPLFAEAGTRARALLRGGGAPGGPRRRARRPPHPPERRAPPRPARMDERRPVLRRPRRGRRCRLVRRPLGLARARDAGPAHARPRRH